MMIECPKMNRFLLLLAITFGVAQYTSAQGLDDLTFGTDSTLDVVTWNIEWFPKSGLATADSVAKAIQAMDADIIALQEISDTGLFRQTVNGLTNFEVLYPNGRQGGLAYVYKTSTITVQSSYTIYSSSTYRNFFPRAPFVLAFSFQNQSFIAINNHFKCCGNGQLDWGNVTDEEYRRFGASDLLKQYIDYNFYTDRVILLGDLNDILTDPPAHNVFRSFLNDSTHYVFADADVAFGPSSGWSYPNWPSHIDHILVTDELFNVLAHPASTTQTIAIDDHMPGGFSTYDNYISDHRPVGTSLYMQSGSIGVQENDQATFAVYPNPTRGSFSIALSSHQEPLRMEVFDVYGQCVYLRNLSGASVIDCNEDWPAGTYIISIHFADHTQLARLIMQ